MPGLPKKYAKMGFKKGWAAFKRSKRTRRTSSRKVSKTASRRRRAYRRVKKYAGRAQSPIIGFGTFAVGAYGGEVLTDNYLRPWMQKNKYLGNSPMGQAAVLLGGSYLMRRFTNKRGIKNIGTGASAYMAAKGIGMLWQTFKGGR